MSEEKNTQLAVLKEYDKSKYNVLVPTSTIVQISPFYTATIREVKADPDPNSGDTFKVGSRMVQEKTGQGKVTRWENLYAPAKPLLNRISQAAGITWDPARTGPISISRDYVMYQAVGGIRLPDGTFQVFVAKKEIDLMVIEDELNEQNIKKYRDLSTSQDQKDRSKVTRADGTPIPEEEWVAAQTKSAMIQWRKHKLPRAETGAMERVIRQALSMKHQYTEEELKKPFIIPRIDFTPDYRDKEVRNLMLQQGSRALNAMFGDAAPEGKLNTAFVQPFSSTARVINIDDDEEDETGYNEEETIPEEPQTYDQNQAHQQTQMTMPEPPAHPEQNEQPQEQANQCAECKVFITKSVKDFSVKKYRRPLCMTCQKKEGGK